MVEEEEYNKLLRSRADLIEKVKVLDDMLRHYKDLHKVQQTKLFEYADRIRTLESDQERYKQDALMWRDAAVKNASTDTCGGCL